LFEVFCFVSGGMFKTPAESLVFVAQYTLEREFRYYYHVITQQLNTKIL